MLKNYLTVAFRNLMRSKVFSLINGIGLAFGMACAILIALYVADEFSYDHYHRKADRIFRVVQDQYFSGATQQLATTSGPVAAALKQDYPEVSAAIRIFLRRNVLLAVNEKRFYGENVAYADSNVFNIFSFTFISGNPAKALSQPNTIVLTHETALKYFGSENPLGKTIKVNGADYAISGIIENPPPQSHFHFNCLTSMSTFAQTAWMKDWGITSVWTYVLLQPHTHVQTLEKKLTQFVKKYRGKEEFTRISYQLQPLTDIHLQSNRAVEMEPNGDIFYVKVLSGIALFILLLACINYVNLTTARAIDRLKEVGMRKIVGAYPYQISLQFAVESLLMTLLAFTGAILIVVLILPSFNHFAAKQLTLAGLNTYILLGSGAIFIVLGLLSGVYPAWYLSRFRPMRALQGNLQVGKDGIQLRNVLVVFQFAVSIILIVATLTAYQQLEFIKNNHLGFEKSYLLNIKVREAARWKGKTALLKRELQTLPSVTGVAASLNFMGEELDGSDVRVENAPKSETRLLAITFVDYDFIETMGIQMATGRPFSQDFANDTTAAFIINEAAMRKFGWRTPEEAIGKQLEYYGGERFKEPIIGVVKDFHFASLHQQVQPLLLMCWPSKLSSISVRIQPENVSGTIASLGKKWQSLSPDFPFEYEFAEEALNKLYKNDERAGKLFSVFAGLGILIACLGLFGLASFTAVRRTKEMGVRKVLGASVGNIVWLLSLDFFKLILIACVVATPIAWYAMHQWLENFAYRIDIGFFTFIIAGVTALLIALLTISYQSIKAALANPVKSLRTE